MSYTVNVVTVKGYKADLIVQQSIDGTVVVKGRTFFRGVATPAVTIIEFTGKTAKTRAVNYVHRLRDAVLDVPHLDGAA